MALDERLWRLKPKLQNPLDDIPLFPPPPQLCLASPHRRAAQLRQSKPQIDAKICTSYQYTFSWKFLQVFGEIRNTANWFKSVLLFLLYYFSLFKVIPKFSKIPWILNKICVFIRQKKSFHKKMLNKRPILLPRSKKFIESRSGILTRW